MSRPEEFPLARELDAFDGHREELMGRAAGKYALLHGDHLAGEFDTEADAIAEGYQMFGNVPFLVKRIEPVDIPRRFGSYVSAV